MAGIVAIAEGVGADEMILLGERGIDAAIGLVKIGKRLRAHRNSCLRQAPAAP